MTPNSRHVLTYRRLALALTTLLAASAAQAGSGGGSLSGLAEREIARRMGRVQDARIAIEQGDKLMAEGDTEAALGQYKSAMDALPDAAITAEWRDYAKAKFADCSVVLARERAKNGRYQEARDLLKGALEAVPGHKKAATFSKELDDPDRWPVALTPEHVIKVQEVERGLLMGKSDYELGNYDKAREDYLDVLRKDPYNVAARRGMEQAERKRAEYFDAARDHTRARMLNDVNAAWEETVPVQVVGGNVNVGMVGARAGAEITAKMNRIIFPQVQFSGASLEEAIEFLRIKSRDLDTQEMDPARKGVNIILNTGDTPVTSTISIDLNNVPMSEALKYITDLAGMKYKVDAYAVQVVPLSATNQEMYQRIFRVPPDFLSADAGGGGAPAAAPADPFAAAPAGGGTALPARRTAIDILKENGITFGDGATAVYNKATSQLIVRNTQVMLDQVEAFVESLQNLQPKQIYITSKFVEVTQKNTEELGFDWLLGGFNLPGSNGVFGSGGTVGNSGRDGVPSSETPFRYPGVDIPVGQNMMTAGNRSGRFAIDTDSIDGLITGAAAAQMMPAPAVAAISGVFTDPQFQLVIRALSQRKGVDLMSAPSVTAKSGQRAQVEVIREFLYPTEFDPPEIPQQFGGGIGFGGGGLGGGIGGIGGVGGAGGFPVTPTTPTTFEMRPVGVRLEVDPVLGGDGYTIDLTLAPEVTEFEGFINYGSPIQTTSTNALGNPVVNVLTPNIINQPVFSSRKVNTSVTIWDGQTVALGGLIREDVQDVEDKIPLLGDIPLLGRLFKTRAEDHFKRNLMVFVTASVIDPSGQKVKPAIGGADSGLPAADLGGGMGMGGPNPLLPAVSGGQ